MKKFILICFATLSLIGCKKNEKEAQVLYAKALNSYAEQNLSKSLEYVNRSLENYSDFYQAQFLKAKILFFTNKNEQSLKILNDLVKKHPEYTDARIWKIRLLIAEEKYQKAEECLTKEIAVNASDYRVYHLYSILAQKLNQMDKRLAMCTKAEECLNESYNVYVELADIWLKLGMRNKAVDALDNAIMISPKKDELKELQAYIKQGNEIK